MLRRIIAVAALASVAIIGTNSTEAVAAKLDKVDMVREGIDLGKIVVNANQSGYTNYAPGAYRFMIRVYAKAKGLNHVYWVAVSSHRLNAPIVAARNYFVQQAPAGNDGWGVYTKSLVLNVAPSDMQWRTTPKALCERNLQHEMRNGRSRTDVLKREWDMTAYAELVFTAAADTKSNNKNNNHKINRIDYRSKEIFYPVWVVCKKGI